MKKVTRALFLGAALPALKHRAPLWAEASLNAARQLEVRLVDASWERADEWSMHAVGTMMTRFHGRRPSREKLLALTHIHPEGPARAHHLGGARNGIKGWVVEGLIDGAGFRGASFVGVVPDSNFVFELRATHHARGGFFADAQRVSALFARALSAAQPSLNDSGRALSTVSKRASFSFPGAMIERGGFRYRAAADTAEVDLTYVELPAGVAVAQDVRSDLYGLDARGQFRFTRTFQRDASIKREQRVFPGANDSVPVDVWKTKSAAGFALVRDGVLSFAHFAGDDGTLSTAALDSFQFLPQFPVMTELLAGPKVDALDFLVPMPHAFRELAHGS